jgi:hypothetical protein
MMVHSPYMDEGDADHPIMGKLKQKLIDIYSAGARKSKQAIEAMMNAETFLDAKEALQAGFVTAISSATPRAVAMFQATLHRSPKLRGAVVARLGSQTGTTATAKWKSAVDAQMVGGLNKWKAIVEVDHKFPGLRQKMIDEANGR